MIFIPLVVAIQVFGERRRFPRPEKPGFYEIALNNHSSYMFKKLPKYLVNDKLSEFSKTKASSNLTAWDFRLLIDSLQAQNALNMGMCGDDYTLTATDIVGVAAYLNTYNSSNSFNKIISIGYEIGCESCIEVEGEEVCQFGCNGGWPQGVLKYIAERGAVEKSCVSSSNPTTCPEKCDDGSNIEFYRDPNFRLVTAYNEKVSFLRELLVSSGPCVAELYVHTNLMSYTGEGIYKMPEGTGKESMMNHVAVVYGFGVENGEPYWLAKNTWGSSWGFKGYFKIEMGKNDSGFEEYFMCINNNVGKGPYSSVPIPPQPDYVWTDLDANADDTSTPKKKKKINAVVIVIPIIIVVLTVVVIVAVILYLRAKKGRESGPEFGLQLESGSSNSRRSGAGSGDDGVQYPRMPIAPFTDISETSLAAVGSRPGQGHFTDTADV